MHPHSYSLLACAITLEEILGISCENPFVTMPSTCGTSAAAPAAAVRVNVSSGRVLRVGSWGSFASVPCQLQSCTASSTKLIPLQCRCSITMTLHFSWPLRQGLTARCFAKIYVHIYMSHRIRVSVSLPLYPHL